MSRMDTEGPHEKNAELMQKATEADLAALEHLYVRFGQVLKYYFAGRGVGLTAADDLVQRIFADLWARRKSFRGESSLETYLFAIASKSLSKEIRRARDHAEKGVKNQPERRGQPQSDMSDPEAELYLEELQEAIQKAIAKLTPGQRQALDAILVRDMRSGNLSAKSVHSGEPDKSRLKRARKRLRELLTPFLDDQDDRGRT